MLNNEEKRLLKRRIQSNNHEIFVISMEQMDAIVRSRPIEGGVQQKWEKLREDMEFGSSYYATVDDLATLSKLIGDLGSFTAKAYVKNYGGKPHIILKGYPGLRRILTSTR